MFPETSLLDPQWCLDVQKFGLFFNNDAQDYTYAHSFYYFIHPSKTYSKRIWTAKSKRWNKQLNMNNKTENTTV